MTRKETTFAEFCVALARECKSCGTPSAAVRNGAEFVRLARALSRIGVSECNDNLSDAATAARDARKELLYKQVASLCEVCDITRYEVQGNDPRGSAIKLGIPGVPGNSWGDQDLYCVPEGE